MESVLPNWQVYSFSHIGGRRELESVYIDEYLLHMASEIRNNRCLAPSLSSLARLGFSFSFGFGFGFGFGFVKYFLPKRCEEATEEGKRAAVDCGKEARRRQHVVKKLQRRIYAIKCTTAAK
ncbi:hypothetical protein FXO38_30591 [Capsicum annuum]|nr:hypothetical protein FXO38_30591 [Capsicum annuum]KAF3676101.1 hypothetical protein FXO37_05491 [Capsicum annuum]